MAKGRAPTASVILAHPWKESLNHAIYAAVTESLREAGAVVHAHDLYAEGFDPVLTVEELGKKPAEDPLVLRYMREAGESDLLAFVHPNWWGQPPAMLKGYVDRVFRPPLAYDFDPSNPDLPSRGMFGGKAALVLNTSNTDEERENGYFRDPLEWEWIRCVFGFCGIEKARRKMFRIVSKSTPDERMAWLAEARALALESLADALREGDPQ